MDNGCAIGRSLVCLQLGGYALLVFFLGGEWPFDTGERRGARASLVEAGNVDRVLQKRSLLYLQSGTPENGSLRLVSENVGAYFCFHVGV